MKFAKRLSALALALSLCGAAALPAYAHDVPDITRTGSVSFLMAYDGAAVGGGSLTLYRVGDVAEEDGNYCFALSDAYATSDVTLDDISDATLAQTLADYTIANSLEGIAVEIGTDGTVTTSNLALGLYLVMQGEPAEGYEVIAPFLVSVPMLENGAYVYDVSAAPKMGVLTQTPAEPVPTTPPTEGGENPAEPAATPAPTAQTILPQTGQLNWPVPVLTVAGLLLILVGWYLSFGRQEKVYGA